MNLAHIALFLVALSSTSVSAREAVASDMVAPAKSVSGCNYNETINITISFNGITDKPSTIHEVVGGKISAIEVEAKKLGITSLIVQSKNYNVNGNPSQSSFNYNGNAGFKLNNAKKATKLFETLMEKGYQGSLNVNSYLQNAHQCKAS